MNTELFSAFPDEVRYDGAPCAYFRDRAGWAVVLGLPVDIHAALSSAIWSLPNNAAPSDVIRHIAENSDD